MRLALLWFDPKLGPSVFTMIPNDLAQSEYESLGHAMDIAQHGFFELENEHINSANYVFEIHSEINRGKQELVMFSVLADKKVPDLGRFEQILIKHADIFKNSPKLYQGFYYKYDPKSKLVIEKYDKINGFLRELYKECELQEKRLKIGNIFILGLDRVGKIPIVRRLNDDDEEIQEVSKLGSSILRVVFENTDLDIYDIGGHNEIERFWELNPDPPEAIVYVVNVAAERDQQEHARREFDNIMNFFFADGAEQRLKSNTPVLLLGSKIHKIDSLDDDFLDELLKPKKYNINYRIGYVSAEKNVGIKENFRWIIEEFLKNI